MKMMNGKTKKIVGGAAIAGAVLSAAAGAYYLYGSKHAPAHRKKVTTWLKWLKSEVPKTLTELGIAELGTRAYEEVSEAVLARYPKLAVADKADFLKLVKRLLVERSEKSKGRGGKGASSSRPSRGSKGTTPQGEKLGQKGTKAKPRSQ